MQISVDVTGVPVLVIGGRLATRTAARYRADGAQVDHRGAHDVDAAAVGANELVVWVDGSAERELELIAECRRRGVPFAREDGLHDVPDGEVTLVGGGPGDGDLMTVAARTALRDADVVLFDRLAPRSELSRWAPTAELIDVGKTPGHHAIPQHEIIRIMLAHATRGLRVVRLKGGDPFVFGRGGEEMLACREAGIPVRVIPGVTSAISAPAAAGIPVTHRDLSRSFTVVSGHAPFDEDELRQLAGTLGTLVVLMGVNTLPHLAAGLARHGMRTDMPAAIIERAYSAEQRTTITALDEIVRSAHRVGVRSPAVIVIGEVVSLTSWNDSEAPEAVRAALSLVP